MSDLLKKCITFAMRMHRNDVYGSKIYTDI